MKIDVTVPDGVSGNWSVQTFTISEADAKFENMRASFHPGSRYVYPGTYKRLMRGNKCIMSNTHSEISDCFSFLLKAHGNILINGLGLGVVLTHLLNQEKVKHITVIEKSNDVINLVASHFLPNDKLEIINANCFEYKPPKGTRYNFVWHDIWDDICTDNLKEMEKLHRKYGKRCDWQDSWCKYLCQRYAGKK